MTESEQKVTGPAADAEGEPTTTAPSLPWLSPLQESVIAAIASTGAVIVGSMLAGSGSSVPQLETLSLVIYALVGSVTWFLPRPKSHIVLSRLAMWAGLSCVVYWLEPIQIAGVRARHDLETGSASEKVQAVERLVRLGKRDLSGADLRQLDLSDADLGNVYLSSTNLSDSNLQRALLMEASVARAYL